MSFEGKAAALPQVEIRVAIATELRRETLAGAGVSDGAPENRERVQVAVDELGQLWVRYWGPRGLVDRHLAMPARPEQIPLVVSLAVGNLVRQEAFELLRDIERRRAEQAAPVAKADAKAAEPAPPPRAAPARALAPQPVLPKRPPAARAPVWRKNSWGHYLVGDFPYFPGTNRACRPISDDACYDSNNQRTAFDVEGVGVMGGIEAAHGRYVMAYSRAVTPTLLVSLRAGFAFSGGTTKDAAAELDVATSKFIPWLFELRAQNFPFRGAFRGALRPFFHLAAGFSEESAEVTLQPSGPDGMPVPEVGGNGRVTMLRGLGLLFAGGGAGGSLELFEQLRLEAELSLFGAFPSLGWFARPAVGLVYDL